VVLHEMAHGYVSLRHGEPHTAKNEGAPSYGSRLGADRDGAM